MKWKKKSFATWERVPKGEKARFKNLISKLNEMKRRLPQTRLVQLGGLVSYDFSRFLQFRFFISCTALLEFFSANNSCGSNTGSRGRAEMDHARKKIEQKKRQKGGRKQRGKMMRQIER